MRAAILVARRRSRVQPEQRLQDPPSVQREGGQEVEDPQEDVDEAEPRQGGGQQARVVGTTTDRDRGQKKHNAQQQAGEGADEGDPRLRAGRAALAAEP